MELTHEFSVKVPVEEAWTVLTDLERIAPCMPGVELQEVEGEEYRGLVKVKVGPMVARYRGVASFQERDDAARRAVVRAEGRDVRGQGNASAVVTATLAPKDGGAHVTLHTDLKITGKVAQFGRGVLADVSAKLLGQFVEALEADVLAGVPASAVPAASAPEPAQAPGARRIDAASSEPVDLVAAAGGSLMKRVVPVAVGIAVVLWLVLSR